MDDAAQAEIAATITQRLYGDFALKETTRSNQCSELTIFGIIQGGPSVCTPIFVDINLKVAF